MAAAAAFMMISNLSLGKPGTDFHGATGLGPYHGLAMFEITVQTVFSAAHALRIRGEVEPLHGHDWHVMATLGGPELDADGLLLDFHAVERALQEIAAPLRNSNLNITPPFDRINPSAERVAEYFWRSLSERLAVIASKDIGVVKVRVTEAPGCTAVYRPKQSRS